MNETIDIPSTAVAVRQSSAVGQALGVDEILAQVHLIQNVMSRVMKEGEHFGTIPGCGDKKTLLQPGAQKLTMTFRLAPEYQIQEVALDRGHKEYRIICTLKSIQSGTFVGQGVGCCSTMESKYRWRGGARKCPKCGKETIIKGKAEYGGGWLCFGKKGGCGAKWNDGAAEIEGQSIERVEHDNPADFFNTVLKMAKKRAFVDATITATAASDIFTQDIGDEEGEPEAPKPTQSTTPPVKTPPAPVSVAPKATVAAQDERFEDAADAPIEVPRDKPGSSAPDEWYMKVIVPIPHKGEKRVDYLKNPDTIGSLYEAMKTGDQEAGHRLWGFANNYEPRGWEKSDGTVMPASESDHKFRDALDAFVEKHANREEQGIV